MLRERTLSSTAGAERRAGNCRQTVVVGSSMLSPCTTPAVEPRVPINDQRFPFGKLFIIKGNN
jgi:hypothetical protein